MEVIQSVQNAKVKEWAKLQNKKGREKAGAFFIEGIHVVEEAIKHRADICTLLVAEECNLHEPIQSYVHQHPSKCFRVTDQVMKKLADTETPQGILAIVGMQKASLQTVVQNGCLLLLLDAIQDPGNLGTIVRTADAAGIDGIILGQGTVDLYNPKVVRSTMGSIFHIPIIQDNLQNVCDLLESQNFNIIATSLEGSSPYDQPLYKGSVALVIGNEANGVSTEILGRSSARVKIPIYGQAESLNAAMAAGIIMYEAVRQRKA